MSELPFDGPDGLDPSVDNARQQKLSKLGIETNASGETASPRTKVSAQQVVLLAVLVLGGGLLFGMRQLGMGPDLVFGSETGITYEPPANSKSGELERLMAGLDQSQTPVQVPMDQVARNPFENKRIMEERARVIEDIPDDSEWEAEQAALQREREIQAAFDGLELQSTMGGRVPVARIGNEFYKVGDAIGEHFILARIAGRTVILMGEDGREFSLEVGSR